MGPGKHTGSISSKAAHKLFWRFIFLSVLLAALLGPYAAALSLTAALFIQAVIFGDGGIISFGVNAFNWFLKTPILYFQKSLLS